MNFLSNITRSPGDPQIIASGPSSLNPLDRVARLLGWFGIGLGLTELLAPRRVTRTLGMEGNEGLVRAFGVREISSGLMSLSVSRQAGIWSRVGGDGLDIATLLTGLRRTNPKRVNVERALVVIAGMTLLDVATASSIAARHNRGRTTPRDYGDRSGFPRGVERVRGAALPDTKRPSLAAAS